MNTTPMQSVRRRPQRSALCLHEERFGLRHRFQGTRKVAKLGVKVETRTYVEHIIRDEKGAVLGLQIRKGYRFPKAGSGRVQFIRAKKGVVLCYGGFSRDVAYRTMQDPKLAANLDSTNQPGATAELWRETSRIGCAQVQND